MLHSPFKIFLAGFGSVDFSLGSVVTGFLESMRQDQSPTDEEKAQDSIGLDFELKDLVRFGHLLPAPNGLDVEAGLNGFALNSPRSSAWTESGSGKSRSNRRRTTDMASLRKRDQPVDSAYSTLGDQRKQLSGVAEKVERPRFLAKMTNLR